MVHGTHQTVHFDRLKLCSAEKGLDPPVDIVLRGPKSGRKTVENEFAQTRPAVRSDVGLQLLDGDDEPTILRTFQQLHLFRREHHAEEPAAAQAQRYPTIKAEKSTRPLWSTLKEREWCNGSILHARSSSRCTAVFSPFARAAAFEMHQWS